MMCQKVLGWGEGAGGRPGVGRRKERKREENKRYQDWLRLQFRFVVEAL